MRIALLQNSTIEDRSTSKLREYLQKNHQVVLLSDVDDLHAARDCDVLLPRHANLSPLLWDLAATLEAEGLPALNPLAVRIVCQNKSLSALAWHRLPQPGWRKVEDGHISSSPTWRGKTVLKPTSQSGGYGVRIFPGPAEALGAAGSGEYLLQSFCPGRVWRLVQSRSEGTVLAYWRQGQGDVLAVSAGAERVYQQPSGEVLALAEKMMGQIGGHMLGLDIIESEDGEVWALEANHCFAYPDRDVVHRAFQNEMQLLLRS